MNSKKTVDYAKEKYKEGAIAYGSKADIFRFKKIIRLIGSHNRVLDLGCYNGTLGKMLIDNGNEVYGIEISREVAEIALGKGIKVKIQDMESHFEFEDNFFGVILASEVIEHILDTDFFIDEIKRVLKPDGYLILSTPNVASLGRRIALMLGKNPFFEASFSFPVGEGAGHVRYFTKGLLSGYLKYKGFKIIKIKSDVLNFNSYGTMCSALLADLFPTLGGRLIVKCKVIK